MKKFLFLSALIFIFIVFPFKETKAYCVWRQIQTLAAPPGQPSQTTTCLGNEAISPATTCGGAVPAHSNCCCDNKQTSQPTWEQTMARIDAAQNGKKPMFTIPNLAIEIPGMASFTQGTCVTGTDGKTNCTVNWIGEYIGGVYKYASGVAGILAVIVLMIGGIIWLISGGDATKIGQSKELIIGSISGLVLLLCSYVILYQINPGLTKFKALTLGYISEFEQLAKARDSGTAEQYKNSPCPTDAELAAGVNFYATGYYKPAWEDSDNFRCVVAMQCSCPNGQDTSKDCDQLY
ncbi:MAG: pilin, partial [Candidatus Falkowbacteria bacterium]|nr:pilin [Candidatus Falkowbacteria bacterium]